MLIAKIETERDDHELVKDVSRILSLHEGITDVFVLNGKDYAIKRKIPVYTPEELTKIVNEGKDPANPDARRGTWVKRYRYSNIWHFMCDKCKKTCPHSQSQTPAYRYCPNCNSPMNIPKEDEI